MTNSNNKDKEEEGNEDITEDMKTKEMKRYEKETGKYAIWRGAITEGFKKWKEGEKIYDKGRERISLYISDDTKKKWQQFKQDQEYSTISKLIRESVNYFIDKKSSLLAEKVLEKDSQTLADISHALKEPLTTIKGFSQLLIETHRDELSDEVLSTLQNIFDQSILLEKKIVDILDDIKEEADQYDVLLIEDHEPTIRLVNSIFESKEFKVKGVDTANKGLEELKKVTPKIILLDIILPDISGYELCKMIKNNEKFAEIPIYFLTAIPESEVEKKLDDTEADGYILKPFDFSDFEIIFKKIQESQKK
jgi:CheY-like chemotaxis protein